MGDVLFFIGGISFLIGGVMHVAAICARSAPRRDDEPLVYRLAFRVGRMQGNGFFWQREDIALLNEAIAEIQRLHRLVPEAA